MEDSETVARARFKALADAGWEEMMFGEEVALDSERCLYLCPPTILCLELSW